MTRQILRACIAAASVVAAIAARAETPALDVKTGLWEMTLHLSRLPPIPNAARLPPEQRARLDAMLGAVARSHTVKTCLTKEKLSWGMLAPDDRHRDCKRSIGSNSARALDMTVDCKLDDGTISTSVHIEAPTREMLKGNSVMTRTNQPEVTSTVEARWLGAECGDVR